MCTLPRRTALLLGLVVMTACAHSRPVERREGLKAEATDWTSVQAGPHGIAFPTDPQVSRAPQTVQFAAEDDEALYLLRRYEIPARGTPSRAGDEDMVDRLQVGFFDLTEPEGFVLETARDLEHKGRMVGRETIMRKESQERMVQRVYVLDEDVLELIVVAFGQGAIDRFLGSLQLATTED